MDDKTMDIKALKVLFHYLSNVLFGKMVFYIGLSWNTETLNFLTMV